MKKRSMVFAAIVSGFLFGYGSLKVLAWGGPIPGVDIPYDSAAYYSPTAVDEADGAPSVFALRDLEAQGGNVLDVTRLIKSQVFGSYFADLVASHEEKLLKQLLDLLPWSNDVLAWADTRTKESMQQATIHYVDSSEAADHLFLQSGMDSFYEKQGNIDHTTQETWLGDFYFQLVSANHEILNDQETNVQTTNDLLIQSNSSAGNQQTAQTHSHLQAMQIAAEAQKTAALNNFVQVYAVHQLVKGDEERNAEHISQKAHFTVANPADEANNKALQDTYGYTRPEPIGMPDF